MADVCTIHALLDVCVTYALSRTWLANVGVHLHEHVMFSLRAALAEDRHV